MYTLRLPSQHSCPSYVYNLWSVSDFNSEDGSNHLKNEKIYKNVLKLWGLV